MRTCDIGSRPDRAWAVTILLLLRRTGAIDIPMQALEIRSLLHIFFRDFVSSYDEERLGKE